MVLRILQRNIHLLLWRSCNSLLFHRDNSKIKRGRHECPPLKNAFNYPRSYFLCLFLILWLHLKHHIRFRSEKAYVQTCTSYIFMRIHLLNRHKKQRKSGNFTGLSFETKFVETWTLWNENKVKDNPWQQKWQQIHMWERKIEQNSFLKLLFLKVVFVFPRAVRNLTQPTSNWSGTFYLFLHTSLSKYLPWKLMKFRRNLKSIAAGSRKWMYSRIK